MRNFSLLYDIFSNEVHKLFNRYDGSSNLSNQIIRLKSSLGNKCNIFDLIMNFLNQLQIKTVTAMRNKKLINFLIFIFQLLLI